MSAELSFDVLVLGGGAAGCVLAARLSEDPRRRVCLVEAGPDYGRYADGRWPASLLDARVDGALTALGGGPAESHDWGFPGVSASRARVIGGCSSHNGCEALWGSPADYDAWADLTGDRSWSYAGLAPYLRRATEALRVRPSMLAELSPIRRTIIDSGAEAGLPFLPDLNAPDALVGFGLIPVNAVGSVRWGAAFAYLDPARGRPNLTILADTLVDRVVVRNRRAEGGVVVVNGRAATLSAPLVVLAAGAFGSPAILQRSGIGDAGLLRNVGIPVLADIPAVGLSLFDHPYVLMSWTASEVDAEVAHAAAADAAAPLALSEIKWASAQCAPGSWDVTVGAWSGEIFDQRAHMTGDRRAGMAPAAMHAVSEGSVAITSSDPTVLPAIDHGLLSDPDGADLTVLTEAVEFCREIARTPSWRAACGDESAPGSAPVEAWIRANVAGTYHPSGTCGMGRVVDGSGGVVGLSGLVVADASVFPAIPAANIHLTVVAVAEKLAEAL